MSLLGQSYGGFLASVMFNLDEKVQDQKKGKAPFFNGGLHVYSPPFNFIRSIELFDEILSEAKKEKSFGNIPNYVVTHFRVGQINKESDISPKLKRTTLPLFIDFGFKSYMDKTLEELERLKSDTFLPKNRKARKAFLKNLTFEEGFRLIDEEGFNRFRESEKRYLFYWVKKAIEKGRGPIRILSSHDDMINDEVDGELMGRPQMLTIPTGGHFGYRQTAWFDQLLIKSFQLKSSNYLREPNLAPFQRQVGQ